LGSGILVPPASVAIDDRRGRGRAAASGTGWMVAAATVDSRSLCRPAPLVAFDVYLRGT
jgi:hypothetical protein